MIRALSFFNVSLFLSLYTTQILGFAFFIEAFVAIMRKNGISLEYLGLIYLLGIFWIIRFLWAPFIDRFKINSKSHFKAWIGLFQTLMILTLLISSMLSLEKNIGLTIFFIALFSFFSASQDVALDALVVKDISKKNRPYVNSLKSAGGIIGYMLGSGLGLIIYDYQGWFYTMVLLSFITLNSLIQLYFYKEKEIQAKVHKIDFKSYFNFWRGEGRLTWLAFLFFLPLSTSFAFITPMLVDMGWKLSKIGFYLHIVTPMFSFSASLLGGSFIKKYSLKKVLVFSMIAQTIGAILYLLPLNFNLSDVWIVAIVTFKSIFGAISMIAMTTLMMDECTDISPASGFALQHGVFLLFSTIITSMSISLAGKFGYENIILSLTLFSIVALYLALKLNIKGESNR